MINKNLNIKLVKLLFVCLLFIACNDSNKQSVDTYYNSPSIPNDNYSMPSNYNYNYDYIQDYDYSRESFSPDDAYDEGYDEGYEAGKRGDYYDESSSYYGKYEDEYIDGYDAGYSDGKRYYEDNTDED